jgi:ankyrin repeat protein
LDEADQYGQTPLYYASRDGRLETVKLLVESGADINHTDGLQSQTALFYAAREGKLP